MPHQVRNKLVGKNIEVQCWVVSITCFFYLPVLLIVTCYKTITNRILFVQYTLHSDFISKNTPDFHLTIIYSHYLCFKIFNRFFDKLISRQPLCFNDSDTW